MVARIVVMILCCALVTGGAGAFAQAADKGKSTTSGPRRQVANIVFAGLAGAVLGLSTLSFYGRPQDRLANIPVGFAIGAIFGTMFTTYKAVAEPREFYGLENRFDPRPQLAPTASYSFEF